MSGTNGNGHEVTPPGGVDIETIKAHLRELSPPEQVLYLAEQIREWREHQTRSDKVIARCATHANMGQRASEQALESSRETRALLVEIRGDLAGELDDFRGAVLKALGDTSKALVELKAAVGVAPKSIDPRESKAGEHTPEELTEMERGTGLAGIVGRIRAERLSTKSVVGIAGLSTILASALSQAMPELIRALVASGAAPWIAVGVFALVGLAAASSIVARTWRAVSRRVAERRTKTLPPKEPKQ